MQLSWITCSISGCVFQAAITVAETESLSPDIPEVKLHPAGRQQTIPMLPVFCFF